MPHWIKKLALDAKRVGPVDTLYCDDKIPSQTLLRKENEFQLIDFLVTQSKAFLTELNEE